MNGRQAAIRRTTKETDITLTLNLDGGGNGGIDTGVQFFDHMLGIFARHGLFDLDVACRGDLGVDAHHSVEDIGICLGMALDEALGDKSGLVRFAHAYFPMDEALARVVVDLSGRPFLHYDVEVQRERVGELDSELVEEFWRAVSIHGRLNLHIELLHGRNAHHIFEAVFKAAARALSGATRTDPRVQGVPSTKGVL
ncbi:MAG: imidazoleglycerol-phosphate dehydratase HisB [Acidobacteriota bacterium]|jgi:imidazoleglycerol-phosphate dehydratase|nr:imidazoleglycerol-phosphate dehydratase HisB [Acidobacteriota bacterium]NLT33136.1 imidazoleglycerol-phosphate dehydratase HisB [Acidobacteriota bacterium]